MLKRTLPYNKQCFMVGQDSFGDKSYNGHHFLAETIMFDIEKHTWNQI